MIRAAVLFAMIATATVALRAAYMAGKGSWYDLTCFQTNRLEIGPDGR